MTHSPRRILVATGIYPPDIGGPATYAKLLADELPSRGVEVVIASFGEVRRLPKIIRHIRYLFTLLSRAHGSDIIFCQDPVSVGLPGWCAARIMGKRLFLRIAGDYAWEQSVQRYGVVDTIDTFQSNRYGWRVELLRRIQAWVVAHADVVITPSAYFKTVVMGWNKKPSNVFHIYNGIDFPRLTMSRTDARRLLSIPEHAKVIVSAGRLVPWKGFPAVVDVTQRMTSSDPQTYLYILGDGPDRGMLELYIQKKGVSANVKLTGSVSRDRMFAYLVAADVFVLNTSFESFSFQIVEAMYAGVPVISTAIGNIAEIIDTGTDGLLVQPDDRDALEQAARRLFTDAGLRSRLIDRARDKSLHFSLQRTLDALLERFNS